jgi:SAM-dependent methyltransferase
MNADIEAFYRCSGNLASRIRDCLIAAGKDVQRLTTADLAAVDELHIRGRQATLELAGHMELTRGCQVLDIGSGLGGAARAVAEAYDCRVTGIDLTRSFCEAAAAMSDWLGLSNKVRFVCGDATDLPSDLVDFDAAMTVHAAMNIPRKDALYAGVRKALKPGRIFAVYDVLRGEGGPVLLPVPWARDSAISHLATPDVMRDLLTGAGFDLVEEIDSTEESLAWFQKVSARIAEQGPPPVGPGVVFGDDFPQMARNQVRNLADRRIRTVAFICRA